MNIAELFVNLGIKGAEKTVGALGSVKKGLGEIGSMSIEAKAGILGAMYGLERMMAISGQAGTGLTNFAALTGLSAQGLQQWQYAARQAGVSSEELTGSLKSVQNSMTNMLLNGDAPKGMALLSRAVGGLDPTKYKDTFYMMTKLQEGIQKMSPEMGAMVAKSFGLSEGTISAMHRNVFTPAMFAKAPTYSDKEAGSLDKSNVAWSNLGNKIEMAFGHFNAKHGQEMVQGISLIVTEVIKLAEALERIAEKLKLFQKFASFVGFITSEAKDAGKGFETIGKFIDSDHKGSDLWGATKDIGSALYQKYNEIQERNAKYLNPDDPGYLEAHGIAPKVQPQPQVVKAGDTHTVHQTIHHHGDAKDTKAVKDTHKTATNHAYRQRDRKQGS